MSSATGSIGLNNVGNILYLSNNITTLSSNLTIGTSPVTNEQFYFLGNANITGNLIGFSNVLIPNGNLGIGTRNPLYRLDVAGAANISGNLNFSGNLLQNGAPYIGSQWTTNGGNIYYNGNVGINRTNPLFALDILGNANITGNLTVTGNMISNNYSNMVRKFWSTSYYGNFGQGLGTATYYLVGSMGTISDAGNFGYFTVEGTLGGSRTNQSLYINGAFGCRDNEYFGGFVYGFAVPTNASTYVDVLVYKNASNVYQIYLKVFNFYKFDLMFAGNFSQYGTIVINEAASASGTTTVPSGTLIGSFVTSLKQYTIGSNVGILNANPLQALDVAGSANVSVNAFVRNNLAIGSTSASANLDVTGNARISGNLLVNGGTMWIDAINNRVGINNTNPQYSLDIKGSANITDNIIINGNANILSNLIVNGNTSISNNLIVSGNESISGNVQISGNLFTNSNIIAYGVNSGGNAAINNILTSYSVPTDYTYYLNANYINQSNNTTLGNWVGFTSTGTNQPTYYTSGGYANGAYVKFDGTNDYLQAPSRTFNLVTNGGATVFLLVRYDNTPSPSASNPMFGFVSSTGTAAGMWEFGDNGLQTKSYMFQSSGINFMDYTSQTVVQGTFYLITAYINSSTSNFRTYINGGNLVSTTIGGYTDVTGNAFVGGNNYYNRYKNMSLSGMMYYDRALNNTEITNVQTYMLNNFLNSLNTNPLLFVDYLSYRVGLNKSSPSYLLDVNGDANISGNLNFSGNLLQNGAPYIGSQWTTSGANIYYNVSGGNVGIATATPQFELDVGGNINFSGNLYQNGNIFSGGGGGQWTTGNGTGNIYYIGNVGINNPTPIYAFDVAGDANIGANVYGNNFYIRNDCILQAGDFSILNGNLTVYERFNAFGESELTGNLTVYNADIYNYGNIYTYNGLYINKNGALYNQNENPNQHAFYAYDTVNFMTTIFGGADDTNAVGYIGVGGYGGSLPLVLNPLGGNVGINTGTPKAKLDVQGNAIINGNLNIQNGNLFMNRFGNLGLWTTNPQANLHVNGNAIINGNLNIGNGNLFMNRFGNLGLWTTNPMANLDVQGNAIINGNLSVGIGNLFMNRFGNLGISTTNPLANLHVNGNAIINGNLNIQNGNLFLNRFGNLGLWTTSPTANLHVNGNTLITGNLNVRNGTLWVDSTSNRVGILNTNPQYVLDVIGDANITGTAYVSNSMLLANNTSIWFGSSIGDASTNKLRLHLSTSSGSFIDYNSSTNGNLSIRYGTTPTVRYTFDGINGRLGLGIQPTVQLDLSTDGARKLTTTAWTTGSDYRIKEDIVDADIDRCYEIISHIKLKHYKWIPEIAEKVEDKSMLGWIAQDVEEYFPKAVSKSAEYGLSDFRTLNADQMYKVMYGALQKVIILNNDLANTLAQQKAQIQYLYQTLLPNLYISNVDVPNIDISNVIIPTTTLLEPSTINNGNNVQMNILGNISSKWDNLNWWN